MSQRGQRANNCRKADAFQLFDRVLCLLSLPIVNILSYLIHPEYAALMLLPTVIFLNRVGYLSGIMSFTLMVIPPVFLLNCGNMDAFFILTVHSLFYLLLSLHLAQDKNI